MKSTPGLVLISGHFNVVHPGHLRLFRFAKECGTRLAVAVESDRLAGPAAYIHESLRLESVKSINWVDECFLMDESIEVVIARLRPEVVVKGKEHENGFNLEKTAVESYGGKLIFSSGEIVFSAIDLVREEFFSKERGHIQFPVEFNRRHGIQSERLSEIINSFSRIRVCVIGDLIIDEYITCEPLGMSQEDPTLVVRPIDSTRFVGGAGIVAAHAAGLGAQVLFVSVSGDDSLHHYAIDKLKEYGVRTSLVTDPSRPTTLKQRFRSKGKTLLRVSHLRQGAIAKELQIKILDDMESILPTIDLLVFSDFNYGCLPQDLVENILIRARKHRITLAADSQSSSQIGDVGRFKEMDLLTPTEREARLSTRNDEDGLVILVEKLRQKSSAKNILLKMGEEGLFVHVKKGITDGDFLTDRLGALNSNPKDVSGAGDSVLITSALTLASGGTIWEAASLGSLAAAIQVGRLGNIPMTTAELVKELK